MKIVYIHQYFMTPEEDGATRSYWFARKLTERGHQVTMITATNKIHHREPGTVMIEGIKVVYVKNEYDNYFSRFQKIKSFLKFTRASIKAAMKEKGVDLVFATSTPLTIGLVALYLRFRKGWRYIFEVRDLWPEFPIQIGAVRNRMLIRGLKAFEKRIYRKSEFVIALSPGMEEGVKAAGTPAAKVCVIPNMSKPDLFYPRKKSEEMMRKFSLDPAKFHIVHFGSMGVANGLDYVIETARILKQRKVTDVDFVFLGYGATEPLLKKMCADYGLDNVSFLGPHNLYETSDIVNCCDASVTCFKNLPILYTNSPNKLFDSLSAGKPVIVNSAGWTKKLVEENDCGFYADPENPDDFASKILKYKEDRACLQRWGKNARQLSEQVFDKAILSERFAGIVEKVAAELAKKKHV